MRPAGNNRVPALDGVRGLAILAVMGVHFAGLIDPGQSGLEYAIRKGAAPLWCGVNLFFVLSGFLITGILLDTRESPNYFRSFYARRTLRIFPLYYLFLVISPGRADPWHWLYLTNWQAAVGDGLPYGQSHLWSLAVEEQFYLLWPAAVYLTPRRAFPWLCAAIVVSSLAFRCTVVAGGFPLRWAYFMTPARLEELACGALAAVAVRDANWRRWMAPLLAAGVCVAAVAFAMDRGGESNKPNVLAFGTSGLAAVFVVGILQATVPGSFAAAVFNLSPLRWLGTYSYALYLFHVPIFLAIEDRMTPTIASLPLAGRLATAAAATVVGASLSCCVAWLSFHLYEKHFLALKRYFEPVRG